MPEIRKYYNVDEYVNEDKNTVTVKYVFPESPIIKEIINKIKRKNIATALIATLDKANFEPISASSYLDERDVFCKKDGYDVADLKCSYKYHKKMKNTYIKSINNLRKLIVELEELEHFHYSKCCNIENDYKNYYLGENNEKFNAVIPTYSGGES